MVIYKVSCFNVKESWWGFFKGVYSLSDLFLAGNTDYLLNDVTGLVGIWLIPESDESSYDVSNDSSEYYEDEESDKFSIVLCAIRTRSCSLIVSYDTICIPILP